MKEEGKTQLALISTMKKVNFDDVNGFYLI
jgi:hypothetical protein